METTWQHKLNGNKLLDSPAKEDNINSKVVFSFCKWCFKHQTTFRYIGIPLKQFDIFLQYITYTKRR